MALAAAPSGTLVSYSFDDDRLDTGPDTVAVFQNSRGRVRLTSDFRYSGYRSVEIREVAGDGAFPELQGYFPLRRSGHLFAHFAFMVADPSEQLNIALAGPAHFTLRKDGIAFWLQSRGGSLVHYSDSMPQRLLSLQSFTWYLVDVAYDIDRGLYDLEVRAEGATGPALTRKGQPNAFGSPGSAVDKFSFIGDTGHDTSKVVYYVDDVLIRVDEPIEPGPLVAPGRRKLSIDVWNEAQRSYRSRPGCLPVTDWTDLGFTEADMETLKSARLLGLLERLIVARGGTPAPPEGVPATVAGLVEAVRDWRAGCDALADGEPAAALDRFAAAVRAAPRVGLYEISSVLALAGLKRWDEVVTRLAMLYGAWGEDPRFPLALAMIGLARDDLDQAERPLRPHADGVPDDPRDICIATALGRRLDPVLVAGLKDIYPDDWISCLQATLLPETWYSVLLWRGAHGEAQRYAVRMAARWRALHLPAWVWEERRGDAALLAGDPRSAVSIYDACLRERGPEPWLLSKLSDAHFLLGDLDAERRYREMVYGALQEESAGRIAPAGGDRKEAVPPRVLQPDKPADGEPGPAEPEPVDPDADDEKYEEDYEEE